MSSPGRLFSCALRSLALTSLASWLPQAHADDTEILAAPPALGASAYRGPDCNQAGWIEGMYPPVTLPLSSAVHGTHVNQVYAGLYRFDPGALPHWSGRLARYQLTDFGDGKIAPVGAGEIAGPAGAERASPHADVLHSRPAVINYNRDSTATMVDENDVLIIYGSNDGMVRAVKGGQKAVPPAGTVITSANARSYSGYEKWTFMPEEFLPRVKRARENKPAGSSSAPRNAGAATAVRFKAEGKAYFADGGIAVYVNDGDHDGKLAGSADTVQIFVSMRRGGRLLYAIDISDPDTPKFMWKKGCPEPGSTESTAPACDAGYGELGQTWSQPTVARIRYQAAATGTAAYKNVLIFGAGYDPAVDDQDPIPPFGANSSNTIGRGIYVVDMADGSVLWRAGPAPGRGNAAPNLVVSAMTYSIPSDIAAIDRDGDGYVDRVYVGDTGGNVWRLDLADPYPGKWTVNKLASLGYAQSASATDRRKFLYPPSVVASRDPSGPYDAVLIGSGDREHPFNGYGDRNHPPGKAVANRFYMLKDRSVGGGWGLDRNNRAIAVPTIIDSGWLSSTANNPHFADITQSNAQGNDTSAVNSMKGWFISLADNSSARPALRGEKAVGAALTVAGVSYFATHRPTPGSTPAAAAAQCGGNLGEARIYRLNFLNGAAIAGDGGSEGPKTAARFSVNAGGGLLPSPVFILTKPKASTPGTGTRHVQLVCFGTECANVTGPALQSRIRTYSYTEGE